MENNNGVIKFLKLSKAFKEVKVYGMLVNKREVNDKRDFYNFLQNQIKKRL